MKDLTQDITSFLKEAGDYQSITPLPKEASVRNYYRVKYEDFTRILCIDENFRSIPYPFLEVQAFLEQNGFKVPKIILANPSLQAILQTDEGDKDLTSLPEQEYIKAIQQSLDLILELQKISPNPLIASKSFDYQKLSFEVNTTLEAYTRFAKSYEIEDNFINTPGLEFLDNAVKFLANHPNKVVTHRDFHARNLLLTPRGLCMIDFQDTMMGCPQYDAASLIYDAYRPLQKDVREELYEYFKERSPQKENRFREYYLVQCFQRSFKALGTYFVMFHDRGYEKYKESIPHCLENLLEIIQLGGFPDSIYLFVYFLRKEWENFLEKNKKLE